jgi:hypothetical protein
MQGAPVAGRGRRGVEGHAKGEVSLRGVSREEPPIDGIRKVARVRVRSQSNDPELCKLNDAVDTLATMTGTPVNDQQQPPTPN